MRASQKIYKCGVYEAEVGRDKGSEGKNKEKNGGIEGIRYRSLVDRRVRERCRGEMEASCGHCTPSTLHRHRDLDPSEGRKEGKRVCRRPIRERSTL